VIGALNGPRKTWVKGRKLRIYRAVLLLFFLTYAATSSATVPMPDSVRATMRVHKVPASKVSLYVHEIGAEAPILSINADNARNPASTIKLLTTWLALEELGPAWTWQTEAYLDGPLVDGVLEGNLVLKGYGDPYFITERLWAFQRQLRARGLHDINGDLVIDNRFFSIAPGVTGKFDGESLRAYNVRPDALLVNFQAVHMTFRPDLEHNRVQILVDPLPSNLKIDNQLKLVNGTCGGYQNGISVTAADPIKRDRLIVSGKFGRDCAEYSMSRAALTAPTFAYGMFRSLWEESGGVLSGTLALGEAPADQEPFYSVASPPLADVITYINKFSNNVMARQLFLTLGVEAFEPPGTLAKSRDAAADALQSHGLDFPELHLDNGAGLSRDTRISAEHLGVILQLAAASPWAAEYVSSLSLAGLDGTLRKRFTDEEATGRMHLKTGRLRDVFATAGYVHARSGREYVVVVLQNFRGADDGPGEEVQAALLRWVHQQ